jgi:S1-C subfamily serine protease
MALGSPLGLSRSLSLGVISSIDRYFEDHDEMVSPYNLWIQTDAAINPGNSGGPLINIHGEVVGINARAIFFGENLGFAIPINTAKLVIDRILKDKIVERSDTGIEWQEIKDYRRYKNNFTLEGVLISDIEAESPAEKAKLKPGDMVYEINEKSVSAIYKEELPRIRKFVSEIPINSTISFKYLRGGEKYETKLITKRRGKFEDNEFECSSWGLSVKELTPRIIQNLRIKDKKGVMVSGVIAGSPADEADVYRGYVIRDVDNSKIEDIDQFKEVYEKLKSLPPKGRMLQLTYKDALIFALLREE